MDIPEPIYGDVLRFKLTEKIIHHPIAESFLYKDATLMISSQPSVGKSVIAIQAAYELSNGLPLFGVLRVPAPMRVWYIQMERPATECLERLNFMLQGGILKNDNLIIDVELQALNFLNPDHLALILKRGALIKPDVIIIDPLYGIATGLSKDDIGSSVAKMLTVMKQKLRCAIWLNHHTVKNLHDIVGGKKVAKEDPFYGAQWLKAHVTASYFAEQGDEGVTLHCKKDSHSCLMKTISLYFDHATYLSTMKTDSMLLFDRYKYYLNGLFKSDKKTFLFKDAVKHLGCSVSSIRALNLHTSIKSSLKLHKSNGTNTLYEIIAEIQ